MTIEPGMQVGDYQILRELGAGTLTQIETQAQRAVVCAQLQMISKVPRVFADDTHPEVGTARSSTNEAFTIFMRH